MKNSNGNTLLVKEAYMPSSQLPKHTHARVSIDKFRPSVVDTTLVNEENNDFNQGVYSNLIPAKTMIGLNINSNPSVIKFESLQNESSKTDD